MAHYDDFGFAEHRRDLWNIQAGADFGSDIKMFRATPDFPASWSNFVQTTTAGQQLTSIGAQLVS